MSTKVKHPKVVVSGMHRSGTPIVGSLLAELCGGPGNYAGKGNSPKQSADSDNQRFHRFHQRALVEATVADEPGCPDWGWTESGQLDTGNFEKLSDQAERLLSAQNHYPDWWGWEDSKTTLFLDFWDRLLAEPRYVLVYRFPWDVADSMQRMGDEVFLRNPEYAYQIWQFYNERLRDFYVAHADRCLLVSINSLEKNIERFVSLLGEKLGLATRDAALEQIFKERPLKTIDGEDPLISLAAAVWPDCTRLLAELDGLADISSADLWHARPHQTRLSRPDATDKQTPDLSVVTPCHEQGTLLVEAIASVERHAPSNCELIIVNDGSQQPRTLEILEILKGLGYFIFDQKKAGVSAARNKAISLARGRYIFPLDDDNRLREGFLSEAIKVLNGSPELGVVYGDRNDFGLRNEVARIPDFDLATLLKANYIDTCAVLRKQVWLDCGGYDPHMAPTEDWDLWINAAEHGWGFHRIPRITFDYRVRPGSAISAIDTSELLAKYWKTIRIKHSESYWAMALAQAADLGAEIRARDQVIRQRDELIQAREEAIRSQDQMIREANNVIHERDQAIHDRDKAIRSQDQMILVANDVIHEREESIRAQDEWIRAQDETIRERDDSINAQYEAIHARDEVIISLQAELAKSANENLALAGWLAARTEELNKVNSSPGVRLLHRYGRFKYRYLLPTYRLLGLPHDRSPDNRGVPAVGRVEHQDNNQVTELPPAHEPPAADDFAEAPAPEANVPLGSNACDVICFPIIDWDFRFQRPQQLMSQLADAGHRVFYISQKFHPSGPAYRIVEKRENVYEVSLRGPERNIYEGVLDDHARAQLFASLNALRREALLGATIAFVQLPFWWPLVNQARRQFAWPIVYDCMDHHAGFSTNKQTMLDQESELLESADLVVVSSSFLEKGAGQQSRNVLMVRNACDYDHFATARKPKNRRPLIGYYGAIADWFDSDLVADLAERRPDWDFTLVGSTFSADVSRLSKLPNVTLPGEKAYAEIPEWLGKFDVSIIPFKRTPLTEATNPVKVYEMLAAGKPIVSVPIPEVASFPPLLRLASTAKEFEDEIAAALSEDDPLLVAQRRAFAREHTWEKRYEALAPAVRGVFPKASIIVVTFNNLKLNRLCLESIYQRTEWPNFEVIVVDNASADGTPDYLREAEATFPNLRVILNDKNLGFAAANNIGLHHATGDYLVLLNNDTVVTRGWLSTLIRHLHRDPTIGLIGPVTNMTGNEAKVDVDYTELEDMPAWAARFVRQLDGQVFSIPMLAMFCVAMRRGVFEKVGLLDEQFGIGMFEDDDYAHRIKTSGLRLVCAADVFVHHFGEASFKKLKANGKYDALFAENRRRYEQKWNMEWVPHQYAPLGFKPTDIPSQKSEARRGEEG